MSDFTSLDATRLYRLARVRPEKLRQLTPEAPRIRSFRGKLSAERKEEIEAELENLRKLILHWPAWAKKHR